MVSTTTQRRCPLSEAVTKTSAPAHRRCSVRAESAAATAAEAEAQTAARQIIDRQVATMARLLGQRPSRPMAWGLRGASISHSAIAAKTLMKALRRMAGS